MEIYQNQNIYLLYIINSERFFPKLVWIFVSMFVCSYLYLGVLTKIVYNTVICFGKGLNTVLSEGCSMCVYVMRWWSGLCYADTPSCTIIVISQWNYIPQTDTSLYTDTSLFSRQPVFVLALKSWKLREKGTNTNFIVSDLTQTGDHHLNRILVGTGLVAVFFQIIFVA